MFDFDASKLLIVGVIALICIPPKDLPRALRTAGQFVGKMRRMASEFQGQFMDAMREADMADVRREARKLADSARVDIGLSDVEHTMTATSKPEEGGEEAAKAQEKTEVTSSDDVKSDSEPVASQPRAAAAESASHSA